MKKKKTGTTTSGVSRRKFVAGASAAGAVAVVAKSKVARAAAAGATYRIHPAIGVARLGNADPSTFFIGPEAPGFGPLGQAGDPGTTVPSYKVGGQIKPQAARFRIYEYAPDANGRAAPVRELNLDAADVASIQWTVHLANKKAAFYGFEGGQGEDRAPAPLRNAAVADRRSLEIDFGARNIAGASAGPVAFTPGTSATPAQESCPRKTNGDPVISYLGQLRTDAKGRLIAIGGKGNSGFNTATQPAMPHWANNDGWFDDASDGPVTAVITFKDGTQVTVGPNGGGAWLLVGPPDFAPGIPGSISGYDLMLDMAVRSLPIPNNALYYNGGPLEKARILKADYQAGTANVFPTYQPSFTEDIRPTLLAAYHLWWVDALVTTKHNTLINPSLGDPGPASASARARVFSYMRAPNGIPQPSGGAGTMPKILGDDPYIGQMPDAVKKLAITRVQYGLLGRWASGAFTPGAPPPAEPTITPHGLDRAALENCVGGAFFPGIEFGWQMRNPALFVEPFRLNLAAQSAYWGETNVNVGPGHFSRQMAVPWQADFNDCRNEGNYAWWPSQRPTDALPTANAKQRLPWARPNNRFEGGNRESTHEDMVKHWSKFGFVLEDGDIFIEKERAASIP